MRVATVDIGSYSVRLTVADVEGRNLRIVKEEGAITSLGSGVKETGLLREDRIRETLEVLKRFRDIALSLGAQEIIAVATEALRRAKNSSDFLERVKEEVGIEVRIITPQEEGRLAFLASAFSLRPKGFFVVVDQGGGSTEFAYGQGVHPQEIISLPIGIVNLTERFLRHDPPTEEEVEELFSFLEGEIGKNVREVDTLVGLGGTITTLSALEQGVYPYDPQRIHGSKLTKEALERWFDTLRRLPARERSRKFPQVEDKRAEVILAGIAMFIKILELFRKEDLIVGDWGVKHGLIIEKIL